MSQKIQEPGGAVSPAPTLQITSNMESFKIYLHGIWSHLKDMEGSLSTSPLISSSSSFYLQLSKQIDEVYLFSVRHVSCVTFD